MASIVYYQAHEEELPDKEYTIEAIEQIIEESKKSISTQNNQEDQEQPSIEFPLQ